MNLNALVILIHVFQLVHNEVRSSYFFTVFCCHTVCVSCSLLGFVKYRRLHMKSLEHNFNIYFRFKEHLNSKEALPFDISDPVLLCRGPIFLDYMSCHLV
jgi:hypothetical protein